VGELRRQVRRRCARRPEAAAFLRELLIPFGQSGCVALFEIDDAASVAILALRHRLEDDCH
jgi:hypothetical protein